MSVLRMDASHMIDYHALFVDAKKPEAACEP